MSTRLGYSGSFSSGSHFNFSGSNNVNMVARSMALPMNAIIQNFAGFFDGDAGSATYHLCIWDSGTLALLWESGNIGAINASPHRTLNAQDWYNVAPNLYLPAAAYWFGWWRKPADSMIFSVFDTGGTFRIKTDTLNTTGAPSFASNVSAASAGFSDGQIGCYVDYIPAAQLNDYDSAAFQKAQVLVFDGTSFVAGSSVQAYDNATGWNVTS